MRPLLFALIPLAVIACSKDKPAPVAPASKITSAADAPQAPTNLRVEALTDTSAQIAWDAVEGATDYDINYRKAQGGRWKNWPFRGARRSHSTIYTLEPDTEYRWAVRAENSDGPSAWTFGENFTTTDSLRQEALSGFSIELLFASNVPRNDRDIFRQAADRWEAIILNDVPDISLSRAWNLNPPVKRGRFIDDLLITVQTGSGSTEVLFSADAYAKLHGVRPEGFPYLVEITYHEDTRDHLESYPGGNWELSKALQQQYKTMEDFVDSQLHIIALHEIGHALGFGATQQWDNLTRHVNSYRSPPPQYPHPFLALHYPIIYFYTGASAIRGFNQVRRSIELNGNDVDIGGLYYGFHLPLNDIRTHWGLMNETQFDIMSPAFITDVEGRVFENYISPVTRGALSDLGYDVVPATQIYHHSRYKGVRPFPVPAGKIAANHFRCTVEGP